MCKNRFNLEKNKEFFSRVEGAEKTEGKGRGRQEKQTAFAYVMNERSMKGEKKRLKKERVKS